MLKNLRGAAGHRGSSLAGTITEHIARLSSTDATLETNLTTLYNSLVTAGVWNKIDLLVVAHKNEADTFLNLVGVDLAADARVQGTPTFTADVGWTASAFNGPESSELIQDADLYRAYDGHFFVYGEAPETAVNQVMQDTNLCTITKTVSGTDALAFRMQDNAGYTPVYAGGGFMGMSCTAIDRRDFQYNAAVNSTTVSQSYTVGNRDVVYGHGGSNITISAFGYGSGLTAAELDDYRDAIEAYAVSRGFNL